MLTPPYHFSTVAAPHTPWIDLAGGARSLTPEILYRGSLPASRNLTFVKRLGIRTLVVLRKKQLKDDDPLIKWTQKRGIDLRWIKAEAMGEEKLGMGKGEVGEVLKIILDPKAYPVYIADTDGISHTTLVVACLRKLQGWHMDCIVNEICRFEPDHDDLPLVPFITSYLSTVPSSSSSSSSSSSTAEATLVLPPPPYPSWLWPPSLSTSPTQAKSARERAASAAMPPPPVPQTQALPFPHPLTARKHPTMRLTFPPAPLPSPSTAGAASPTLSANNPAYTGGPGNLSRVSSRRDKSLAPPASPVLPQSLAAEDEGLLGHAAGLISAGLSGISHVLAGAHEDRPSASADTARDRQRSTTGQSVIAGTGPGARLGRQVSFHSDAERDRDRDRDRQASSASNPASDHGSSSYTPQIYSYGLSTTSSPTKLSREMTISSSSQNTNTSDSPESLDSDQERANVDDDDDDLLEDRLDDEEDEEDDEDEDEEDEDDDDDDDDQQPTSQYISALDLAGFS
ncbi:hypothetical protein IAU60_004082 [Kwoniella sp. DSM 27419]